MSSYFKLYNNKPKKIVAPLGNLLVSGLFGQYESSVYVVDDSLPASNEVLWSSAKVGSCATKANLVVPAAAGNLANIDATGQYQDSTYKVNDVAVPAATVLYSSLKLDGDLATKADLSVPAAAGNLANIDALGQYADSTYKVDDVAVPAATVLYSSLKLDGELATKADLSVPAAAGNLANIDALGQYADSTYKVDDVAVPAATVLYSSLKLLTKSYVQGTFSGTVADASSDIQLTATAAVDIYSEFAANVFTATRAGRYIVTAGVLFQSATISGDGYTQIAIQAGALKFFDRTVWHTSGVPIADGQQNNVSAVALLTAGQTIEFRVWQFTGTSRTILPVSSKFTISEM